MTDDIMLRAMRALRLAISTTHRGVANLDRVAELGGMSLAEIETAMVLADARGFVRANRRGGGRPSYTLTSAGRQHLRGKPETPPLRIRLDGIDLELAFHEAPNAGAVTIEVTDGIERVGETVLTRPELSAIMRMAGL